MDPAAWGAAGVIAAAFFGMIGIIAKSLIERRPVTQVPVAPGIPVPPADSSFIRNLEMQIVFWQRRADVYAAELSSRGIPLPYVADPRGPDEGPG